MSNKQSLSSIGNLQGKTVIVRAGLNVPLDEQGVILDDYRIEKFLPTLNYLVEQEAKVIVLAHIGRDVTDTLEPVADYINRHIPLKFIKDFFAEDSQIKEKCSLLQDQIGQAENGTVFMLDNIRQTAQEKNNSDELGLVLGNLADVYVNEAFSVSHREHCSLVSIPKYTETKVTGIVCQEEVEQLSLALQVSKNAVAVIGGNKFATKLPLISQFLNQYSNVVVAGALANTLYAIAGYEVGTSVYESDLEEETVEQLRAVLTHENLYLPAIVIVTDKNGEQQVKHIAEVSETESIVDIAPEGLVDLEEAMAQAQFIVWNGPLGYYEGGYTAGTNRMLELIAINTFATSLVGGGNTVDAVRDAKRESDVSFLSTGGGAMIQFLTDKTLPALDVLD